MLRIPCSGVNVILTAANIFMISNHVSPLQAVEILKVVVEPTILGAGVLEDKQQGKKESSSAEDGWPLGLQRLNRSVGLARSLDLSGSVSFSTLLTFFASSSSSSFDLESEETEGSFPSSIRANTGGFGTLSSSPPQRQPHSSHKIKKNQTDKKPRNWLCSLCSKPVSDDEDRDRLTVMTKMVPLISLGYLLEEERKAMASINRKSDF
ncbi:hypothetical protein V2J09_010388 [Rumex salicifolius]